MGEPATADRSRRFHILLDVYVYVYAYGYADDRHQFGAVVPQRARQQAGVIRDVAGAGDPIGPASLMS